MSFPRYQSYKDSGVEWLGEVPGHWNVKRLKQACHVFPSNVDKKSHDGETAVNLCNYTDIYYNETITTDMEFMAATASTDQIAKFTLRAGDTIITKDSETADDIAIGAYVPTDLPGVICGYHLSMVRPMADTNGAFVKRLFDSTYVKSCVAVRANGLTRVGLGQYEIDNLELPFPPIDEQTQIAAFLDRETAKIDGLVAEQRRLMELLKEKRQAVISHAVTQGLNPNAPMKPSGIEWLGNVPEHWEARTIAKASTKITNGFVGPTRDILVDDGTPYIQATHIKNGRVNFDDGYFVRPEWSAAHAKSILCEGDVLIVQTGAGTGDVGLVSANEVGYNCHALIIVAPDKSLLHGTFLSAVLQSTYGQEKLTSIETGAMHPHLNCGEVKFVEIPLPPLDEQTEIVAYINRTASQFDTLTAEAQRAIALLQERRTALISAAVTGQIDVRRLASC